MEFKDKLKKLRKDKKLDQKELADKEHLNISLATLRRYEQKNDYPNIATLKKMKEIFDVSYDYLLDDNCTTITKNLEIAKELGTNEKTINSIKEVKDKEFFEDFITNEECNELLALIKEKADLSLILEYGIINCEKLYKLKNYNEPNSKMINAMKMLVDYMKQKKERPGYWGFLMDNKSCKGFISSINYILNCWNNHQKINESNENLTFFNIEVFEKVKDNIKEYDRYCLDNITVTMNKFNSNYVENKKKKLKL